MADRLAASARLAGTLASGPLPIVSIRREDRVLTAIVVWSAPIGDRIAGAQLHLMAAAVEVASEGRSWTVAVEAPPTPMTKTAWRWGSLVLVPATGTDEEVANARLVLDNALRDYASRVQHGR